MIIIHGGVQLHSKKIVSQELISMLENRVVIAFSLACVVWENI